MDSKIIVHVRDVYGKTVFYPANKQAHLLAQIAGTKTLTAETIALAHKMGFSVTAEARELKMLSGLNGNNAGDHVPGRLPELTDEPKS